MAKSGRLEVGDNIYGHIVLYSTTVTYLASKSITFGEKSKRRAITPFKVIQGHRGRYQSKARMRLPIVINSNCLTDNLSRTVAELSQCSNFGHFAV